MVSTNPEETSVPDAPTNRSRRKALKLFERYAAAAPTVARVKRGTRCQAPALGQ